MRRKVVAVVGAAECAPQEPGWKQAYLLGKALIDDGYRVLTGGLGGVMEAAMKGARASASYQEGDTVALLPSFSPDAANPYADIVIATGADLYMNGMMASADAVAAIGGGAGTLSEISAALERGRPVFSYENIAGSSELIVELREEIHGIDKFYAVQSAEEVIAGLAKAMKERGIKR